MATLRNISLGKGVRSNDPRLSTGHKSNNESIPWLENKGFIGKLDDDQPGNRSLWTDALTGITTLFCFLPHVHIEIYNVII